MKPKFLLLLLPLLLVGCNDAGALVNGISQSPTTALARTSPTPSPSASATPTQKLTLAEAKSELAKAEQVGMAPAAVISQLAARLVNDNKLDESLAGALAKAYVESQFEPVVEETDQSEPEGEEDIPVEESPADDRTVPPSPGFTPTPPVGMGILKASEPGVQINVRAQPSIESPTPHYGLSGDQVQVLTEVVDSQSQQWFRVRFQSGAEGWVRGDLIAVGEQPTN